MNTATLAIRSLAKSNVTGTEREAGKRSEAAVKAVRALAADVGCALLPEGGFVVTREAIPSELAGWIQDHWTPAKRARLITMLQEPLDLPEETVDDFAAKVRVKTQTNGSRAPRATA